MRTNSIPPSNQSLHSSLRTPIPPSIQNVQLHRPITSTTHAANGAPNTALSHTPASQHQSLQDPTAAENRTGASDPSSQPTPSLDYAGSLDSAQNINRNPAGTGFFAPQTPAEQVLFGPADRFGLMGLLQIIKHADPDYSMLALGKDLTHLGLDLGSSE